MPAANELWVRRVGLSNSTATQRGPANGLHRVRVRLQLRGEGEDLGLLGRAQVVVGEEVPQVIESAPAAVARSSSSGRTATKPSSCAAVTIKRRGEPEHVRPGRVDDEAGVQRGVGHPGGDRCGQGHAAEQPATPDAGDHRVAEGVDRGDEVLTHAGGAVSRPSRSITAMTARPAIAATGLPPKVLP